ncbi:hypothetical protein ACQ86O_18995 [Serratia sp. L9]
MINTLKRRELIIDPLCREGSVRVAQWSYQVESLVTDSRIPAN